jgi:hypothetical protein
VNSTYSGGGGGIFVEGSGVLTIDHTEISGNTVDGLGIGGGIGAAVTAADSDHPIAITITDCTISQNAAKENGGGIAAQVTYNAEYVTLAIHSSTISDNEANWGGGIYSMGTLIIDDETKISGNTANLFADTFGGTTNYYEGIGGGLYIGGGTANISDGVEITDNEAKEGGGADGMGGGIYVSNYGRLTIEENAKVKFSGNQATSLYALKYADKSNKNGDYPLGAWAYANANAVNSISVPALSGVNFNNSSLNLSAFNNYDINYQTSGGKFVVTLDPTSDGHIGDQAAGEIVESEIKDGGKLVYASDAWVPIVHTVENPGDAVSEKASEGYEFLGWFNGSAAPKFDFDTPVTATMTLTARYAKKPSGGGGTTATTLKVQGIEQATGKVIYEHTTNATAGKTEIMDAPTIEGYTLIGDKMKTITIKSGVNTVIFEYETAEGPAPTEKVPPSVSGKLRATLETVEHFAYIGGYGDGTIRPDHAITRAEVAAIFFRLIKDTTKNDAVANSLIDVADGEWYAQAVNYLAEHGIIAGYYDATTDSYSFKPQQNITRAEFAAITARFDDLMMADSTFDDVSADYWAASYIGSSVIKGWISGYLDGTFRPENDITRAEVVTIVNQMIGRKLKKDEAVISPYSDLSAAHWSFADIIEASIGHEYDRDEDWFEIWK